MRQMLNTLYITLPDVYLALSGDNILIKQENSTIARYPLHNLEDIVVFSYLGISPQLIQKCIEDNIGICYLTINGRFIARLRGESRGNILLRREQYRLSDSEERSLEISKNIIASKIYNEKWTIERYIRQYEERIDNFRLKNTSIYLSHMIKRIPDVNDIDELRGIEGASQVEYFSCFDDMILQQKGHFEFERRTRRPPLNPVNAMLSFIYAMLSNDVASSLESVGLDAYAGFMHTDRPGRISLALDLVEELRSPIADRFVLSLINTNQVKPEDFSYEDNGAVLIKDEARKKIIQAWQKRKQETITHPFLNEKIEWGLVPFSQALLLARYLRGDLDGYPAFLWK